MKNRKEHKPSRLLLLLLMAGLLAVLSSWPVYAAKSIVGPELGHTSITIGVKESCTDLLSAGRGLSAKDCTFRFTKDGIAKVSKTGTVTGVKVGKTTLRVKADRLGVELWCDVTVKKAPTGIAVSPAKKTIAVGKTLTLTCTLPSGSASHVITYVSSNPSVATVSKSGKVTAHKAGKTVILARTYNGKKAMAAITVEKKSSGISEAASKKIEKVIAAALSQLGKPYIYASGYEDPSPSGFDCSGLTFWSYMQVGIHLKDSAYGQGNDARYKKITRVSSLRRGDILCFHSDTSSRISHVGIYLGKGWFVHASSAGGKVMKSQLKSSTSDYYLRNLSWGYHVIT